MTWMGCSDVGVVVTWMWVCSSVKSRSAATDATDKRLPLLHKYLQRLLVLPDNIRYDSIVNHFTSPSSDDLLQPVYIPSQATPNGAVLSSSFTSSTSRFPPRHEPSSLRYANLVSVVGGGGGGGEGRGGREGLEQVYLPHVYSASGYHCIIV